MEAGSVQGQQEMREEISVPEAFPAEALPDPVPAHALPDSNPVKSKSLKKLEEGLKNSKLRLNQIIPKWSTEPQ